MSHTPRPTRATGHCTPPACGCPPVFLADLPEDIASDIWMDSQASSSFALKVNLVNITAYCDSSMIAYELAHIMEGNGNEIKQLVMIVHFLAILYFPLIRIDEETLIAQVMKSICDLYRIETKTLRLHRSMEHGADFELRLSFFQTMLTFMYGESLAEQ